MELFLFLINICNNQILREQSKPTGPFLCYPQISAVWSKELLRMKMFYSAAVQRGGHQPQVDTAHLKLTGVAKEMMPNLIYLATCSQWLLQQCCSKTLFLWAKPFTEYSPYTEHCRRFHKGGRDLLTEISNQ